MRRIFTLSTAVIAPLAVLLLPTDPAAGQGGVPTCQGRHATIVGTRGDDRLMGTPGPDVIVGLDGWDYIEGRGGNDIICGGPGANDEVFGGRGDDWVQDRVGDSTVGGGPGDDVLVVGGIRSAISFASSPRGVVVNLRTGRARGYGHDRIISSTDRITVYGTKYEDTILGPSGGGHFFTGGGSDRVVVTDGSIDSYKPSWVESGGGDDVLVGGPGRDVLVGETGSDQIWGQAGSDYLSGGSGADILTGGPGSDELNGGEVEGQGALGPDILRGGKGDDSLEDMVAASGDQGIYGGPGHNSLYFESRWDVTTDMRAETLSIPSKGVVIPVRGIVDMDTEYGGITWTAFGTNRAEHYGAYDTHVIAHMFGGDDEVVTYGSDTDDYVAGGSGSDTASLDGGTDTCISVEHPTDCEIVQ